MRKIHKKGIYTSTLDRFQNGEVCHASQLQHNWTKRKVRVFGLRQNNRHYAQCLSSLLVGEIKMDMERRSLGISFSDTFSLRGVQTSRTRMTSVCSAHVVSLHLTLSILMFHPPSFLFPDGHFETTFPTSTSSTSLPHCSRPGSAGQAHFRTSGEEFGYLADPTHSTRGACGIERKE